jgi:hypothetical protein
LGIDTSPADDSSSPEMMRSSVDFPEPLAPTTPYRLPGLSCSDTSRNSVRAP